MFKTEIIGCLGADAVIKEDNNGQFITFRVAHSDAWVDKDNCKHENTTWVSCILNIRSRNLLPYLLKGGKVFVRGNSRLNTFTGHDGKLHAGININVTEIELCDLKKESNE